MEFPIASASRRQPAATSPRLALLAALALAAALATAGTAHAAAPQRSPSPPTFQVATATPAQRMHPDAASLAPDAAQAPARPRFPGAPSYRWGCPSGTAQGCW
ncbi:MAG: hypothetical protein ACRYGC_11390 [Janthinobacterium lividum]